MREAARLEAAAARSLKEAQVGQQSSSNSTRGRMALDVRMLTKPTAQPVDRAGG